MPKQLLSEEKAAEILRLINEGIDCTTIANRFGVSYGIVKAIAYGDTWKHIPGERPEKRAINTNRFRGVYHDKRRGNWIASLRLNGRNKHLGSFGYELLAACCVNAHIAWLGLDRSLNVIDPEEWKQAGIYD